MFTSCHVRASLRSQQVSWQRFVPRSAKKSCSDYFHTVTPSKALNTAAPLHSTIFAQLIFYAGE